MPTTATAKMTADEFFDWSHLPENEARDCELDRGEVIDVPSPGEGHGFFTILIGHLLMNYVLRRGRGTVVGNDAGLVISDNTVLGPDLMLFDETIAPKDLSPRHSRRVPLLCVEVLSPSNRMTQMMRKVTRYFERGVRLVWLVDPDERSVHVFRTDELPKLLDDTETLTGNGVLPDFSCLVADLFRLPGAAN